MGIVFTLLGARFTSMWEEKGGGAVAALHRMVGDSLLWAELTAVLLLGMTGIWMFGCLCAAYDPQHR
jgi:hypothetical protein